MGVSFAELVLVVAAIVGIYKALKPLQRRVEEWLLDRLQPGRRKIIDVRPEEKR